ncbi:hypothetical protein GE061_005329 [Apolygus lucorum]|uniref:Uncharacterized protein n=1 Tax=Apolygus lucorum TaxID=248454 RepID=A0A6A4IIV9_APOLU|nr:hypothetical protein GE061_005329 [Apolygus lucorum]
MVINILLLTTVVVAGVIGAPHHDGAEGQTHSPVVAPDSESIVVGAHSETHHSDVYLVKTKRLNETELSGISSTPAPVDTAGIHHSDTYMMKGHATMTDHAVAESTTLSIQETTTAAPQATEKARSKNESNGAYPVAPVYHANPIKKGGEGIMKSVVAHSPVASFVENSKSEKSEKHQDNTSGSVVAHGPMIKNLDHQDKKHGSSCVHKNEDGPVRSTVQHAPMATDHHPPMKTVAHHPSLSKSVPVSSGHVPILNHPVVDEKHKHEEPTQDNAETTVTVEIHPPTATDLHTPKTGAHHPSLSKSESAPTGSVHAPLAIPHNVGEEIHVEKRSEMIPPSDAGKESTSPPKIIEIHHPLLSKTEGAKSNHDDGVASTTEITGNSLETQRINSGHQLASSHPATISPST